MIKRTFILALAALFVSTASFADRVLDSQSKRYTLDRDGAIILENVNGDVDITSWDGEQVELDYVIKGKSDKDLERTEVRIDHKDDLLRVETIHRKGGWFSSNNSASVEYSLRVPAGVELRSIETVNGSLFLYNISSDVKAETVNGEIEATGLAGDVKLGTVNGGINAQFDQVGGDQRIRMDSVNGRIELSVPDTVDADIKAETVNGSLRNDFDIKVSKGLVGKDMEGEIGAGTASIQLDTVNGSIQIKRR